MTVQRLNSVNSINLINLTSVFCPPSSAFWNHRKGDIIELYH